VDSYPCEIGILCDIPAVLVHQLRDTPHPLTAILPRSGIPTMRLRVFASLSLIAAILNACQSTTSPTPRVALTVQSSGVTAAGQRLGYTVQIRNDDVDAVWVVGCETVSLGFEIRRPDGGNSVTSFLCSQDRMFRVSPGATLRDSGVISYSARAEYLPSVMVSRSADGRNPQRVPGTSFTAP